jgi:hypothetical protein
MAVQQSGVQQGTEVATPCSAPQPQMTASQPVKSVRALGFSAFGTSSGAAIVFNDYASI